MSRILPIKNGLDDRFINQTDVITENALEQVINGQGGGGGQKVIIIEPNLPTSESGFPVNSDSAWTAQELCGYLNITQEELNALFSREKKIIYGKRLNTEGYSRVVTGDPSSPDPTFESTEVQTAQIVSMMPIPEYGYVEGYDPKTRFGVPGLKVVQLGKMNLYKLNEKYGNLYFIVYNEAQ